MVQEEACIELLWSYHAAHDIALYMNYFNWWSISEAMIIWYLQLSIFIIVACDEEM
jgi:hypothetical protein